MLLVNNFKKCFTVCLFVISMVILVLYQIPKTMKEPTRAAHISATEEYKYIQTQGYAGIEDLPLIHTNLASCSAIISGDKLHIKKARLTQQQVDLDNKTQELFKLSTNCTRFHERRKYLRKPVNKEEEKFPIAFSLLMFKDIFLAERLLRAIYRTQNVYCIHVDLKSAKIIHKTIENIAKCFDNIFIASTLLDIKWGGSLIAKAELICLQDLLKKSTSWKYFINMCGQEFPIKTNLEVVRVLKAFNGANDVEGLGPSSRNRDGLTGIKQFFHLFEYYYKKAAFPYNITWVKGSTHAILSRSFVEFLIYNDMGKNFTAYISDIEHADEWMWNPINFSPNLGAPGSYTGYPYLHQMHNDQSVVRYKLWRDDNGKYKCRGIYARNVCIISMNDLFSVVNSRKMFVNKFHSDYEPFAYDCLEEYVWNNTRLDIQGIDRLNISYYEHLPFVKNHI